jgi:glycosyltransferase involved in cell wall biosynthesis
MILGGAQENTLLSVEGLNQLDRYEVTLVTGLDRGSEGELLTRARQTSKVIVIPELGRGINPWADLVAFLKLYRIVRQGGYHIVHTHSSKAGVLGRVAAWLAGVPVIVHTLHSLVFHEYQPWVVNRLWWAVKKLCAPLTDHFISVSAVISEKAIAEGIGEPERFSTIYSGMELDWFTGQALDPGVTRRDLGIPEQSPVVGKIARLFPLKGHDQLLDAAPAVVRRYPEVRFLLVGDGMLDDHVRRRAHDLGIFEHFVFTGLVPRERIPQMLSAVDVLVHTSLREGLARVLPQALAMGKPCVAFDIDGAREVVIPGKTGFLVDPEDSVGLADAICQLLADGDLRRRMGEEGKRRVDPAFRSETMVREIALVYERLLAANGERVRRFEMQRDAAAARRFRTRCVSSVPALARFVRA